MPFEQLPYQCFQEARKILQADREEKLKQIETQKRRIALNQARDAALLGGEHIKKGKIMAMERHLEELKVLADVNDPMIKKLFEDGQGVLCFTLAQIKYRGILTKPPGDMNRPIYRYLADKKWREFKRKLMMQRLTQMHVVPDLLPHLDPVADISFTFGQHHVQPGAFVNSAISERVPKLTLQVFDKGPRLVTIAVVDPDVPNLETDGFDFRCHYLAPNIQLDPTNPHIYLSRLKDNEVILPWLPPHALKGSPYHRLAIFVLQQEEGKRIDVPTAQQREKSLGFNLRSFMTRYSAKPVTATMFRNVWDDSTMGVMERAGLEGANIELKRKRGEKLPYKKKDGSRYR